MTGNSTPDLLAAIVAATRERVAARADQVPVRELERDIAARARPVGRFRAALARSDRVNVIAECKRRSPSRGILRGDYDPAAIAVGYQAAGAAAISVLTEPGFFDGSLEHLAAVRAAVTLPLLRKDFIVHEYQLLEARAAGADAILLIVAAITGNELQRLSDAARALGLDALVEVHDEAELDRALAARATLIGVNNRNLRTLRVDLEASHRLAPLVPDGVLRVAESGIKSGRDVAALRRAGYGAVLVGEQFMTAPDPADALARLLLEAAAAPPGAAVDPFAAPVGGADDSNREAR
jgi:indole-3-glycerol phosphate synthase